MMTILIVKEIIGSSSAMSPVKGFKLYNAVKRELDKKSKVTICFDGIQDFVTAFANSSIGKLYMEFPKDLLDESIKVTGLSDIWLSKWNQAINLGSDDYARASHSDDLNRVINS